MEGQVITLTPNKSNPQQSFVAMQGEMESELERRRKEWENEVTKMQEDFFQIKINENQNNANNKYVNKTLDIHIPPSGIQNVGPSGEITEIGNAKIVYDEKPGGNHVIKFQFDMRGFDPRAISVRADGSKLLITAKVERELSPGNKSSRQYTRQVDIPTNVESEELTCNMSSDGTLSVEAPYDQSLPPTPTIDPPAYPAIENDEIYYVTRSSPKQHYYSQIHQSSPFAADRYNLHSDITETHSSRPNSQSYITTTSYRQPEPVKITRYFSDYQDPGPLIPNSRGEILRNEAPKQRIYHTPVPRAEIPIFRDTPSYRTTTVTNHRDTPSFKTTTVTNNAEIPLLRDTPSYKTTTVTNHRDTPSFKTTSVKTNNHIKPKVTIIREYETSNGDISSTATSPITKTSIFQEFNTSPRAKSPSYRERNESTSSGEKIIYPTKYKKQMSISQSSDSESSFSTSPPVREIIPRQLFPRSNSKDYNANTNGFTSPAITSPITTASNHPNIVSTEEGQRLKMHIEIGNQFKPEEITIHLRYKKVVIRAMHEEIINGRTSRSEFSKEFDLPGPLEPTTVKAALNNSGKLFVGGSLMTNLYHDQVLDLVLCDMPTNGRACTVKY